MRMILAVIFCGVLAGVAHPHEGEEHAQPSPAAVPAPGEGLLAEYAASDVFELVLKHPALVPGRTETVRIFLTDYATNAPIGKAGIELQAKGPVDFKSTASGTEVPGIYESRLSFPQKGDYDLIVDIKAGDRSDTLVVKIPADAMETSGKRNKRMPVVLWSLIAGMFLAACAFAWTQRHRLTGLVRR